ncbi:hypothetical protein MD273_05280 [Marinobacter pelagius]|uniref:hypothetical protein n=1 Tax=Marinobacter sp. C7 TaxID=2951363 RepID=UPI001EEFBCA8|nr:hypothetical protein [Marinobacter sp. C7]MCG7199139.1 hypothetical protein [Marinobacter sp. C7]
MSEKVVFLHIGLDKTGSTAIQQSCALLSEELLGYGYYWIPTKQVHHGFVSRAVKQGDKEVLNDLRRTISTSDAKCHLLSFEGFYRYGQPHIETLLSVFKGFSVQVIIYLRQRPDKMSSGLGQRLKFESGANLALVKDLYQKQNYHNIFKPEVFDYRSIVKRWEDGLAGFENSRVHIGIYEKESLRRGDLLVDFYTKIGFKDSEIDHLLSNYEARRSGEGQVNPSLSLAAQDMMALCSMLTNDIVKLRKVKALIQESDNKEEKNQSRVPEEFLREMDERFKADDEALAQQYFARDQLFLGKTKFRHAEASEKTFFHIGNHLLSNADRFEDLSDDKTGLDSYVETLRRSALLLEKVDLKQALGLMKLAAEIRPDGPFIKGKIREYQDRIEKNVNR